MNKFLDNMEKLLLPNIVTEIGSSLGGTLSATQALMNGAIQDPELRRDLLGGMDHELRYLRFLFENWILLQSVRTGKIKLNRRKLNFHQWFVTILASWQKVAPEKNLQWQLNLTDNLPEIYVDPDRLGQALGNLLYASIASAPLSSKIAVETTMEGRMLRINLQDYGPQVSPLILLDDTYEVIQQNFENHPRLKKGLGIGIVLAHRIVLAHQGEMDFDDSRQFNSSMTIYLPA